MFNEAVISSDKSRAALCLSDGRVVHINQSNDTLVDTLIYFFSPFGVEPSVTVSSRIRSLEDTALIPLKTLVTSICILLLAAACSVKGDKGDAGKPGIGCSYIKLERNSVLPAGGAIITCENGIFVIHNSEDSKRSSPPVLVVDTALLCGKGRDILIRISNGDLFHLYEMGGLSFLAALSPGKYMSLDGTRCFFTVHDDMKVSYDK